MVVRIQEVNMAVHILEYRSIEVHIQSIVQQIQEYRSTVQHTIV